MIRFRCAALFVAAITIAPLTRGVAQNTPPEAVVIGLVYDPNTKPGVLVLYAVAEKDNPNRVRVFEIYRDMAAYRSHLETAHFKKYKATTEKMVKSLKLVLTTPIMLGTQTK